MNFRVFVTVLSAVLMAGGRSSAEEACLSDWSVAAPIVRQHGLVSVEALAVEVKARHPGDIVKTTLCEAPDGTFAFRVVVRARNGELKTLRIDAARPFKP